MKVKDVYLDQVQSISQYAKLTEVAEKFDQSGSSDLMVVDEQNNLIGLVSEGDLIRYCMPNYRQLMEDGLLPDEAFKLLSEKGGRLADDTVQKVMVTNVIYVNTGTPLYKAASYLSSKNIRKLPVLENDKLVGTISRATIAKYILQKDEETENAG